MTADDEPRPPPGPRSSDPPPVLPAGVRVLVLGGAGFIGRHAVTALIARGATVVVGSRHPGRIDRRLPTTAANCERRRVRFETLQRADDWPAVLGGIDVVVNCVGILRERGTETYDAVHHRAPAALATACTRLGLPLLHVSALGLEGPCRSGFLRSKQAGEAAVRAGGVTGAIVRPSLLDAERGGYGSLWIRRVARWPLLALPADATGRIAAMHVEDLGEALARLATGPAPNGLRELEFGGTAAMTLRDYIATLRASLGKPPARVLPLPGWAARLGAHACDVLHVTPFSFGHWELLRRDNRPARDDLAAVLGRSPRPIGVGAATPAAPAPAPAGA